MFRCTAPPTSLLSRINNHALSLKLLIHALDKNMYGLPDWKRGGISAKFLGPLLRAFARRRRRTSGGKKTHASCTVAFASVRSSSNFSALCCCLVNSLASTTHAYSDFRVSGPAQVSLHSVFLTLQGMAASIGSSNFFRAFFLNDFFELSIFGRSVAGSFVSCLSSSHSNLLALAPRGQ